jgi:hypothetical protein
VPDCLWQRWEPLSSDEQRRKLELMMETSRQVLA